MGPATIITFASGILALLLALFIDRIFILKKRALIGYFAGIIPFLGAWYLFMLPLPSAAECRENPFGCEGMGLGILIYASYFILVVVVYTALSISMTAYYRHTFAYATGTLATDSKKIDLLKTILILGASITLCGWLAFGFISLINHGIFVRWHNLGNPPEPGLTNRLEGEISSEIRSYNLREIQVISTHGRSFQTDFEFCLKERIPKHGNCWFHAQPGDLPQVGYMNCRLDFWIWRPPQKVIDQAQAKFCNVVFTEQTNYVLLDDGNIWVWQHRARNGGELIPMTIVLGLVSGLIIGAILVWRTFRVKE